MRIVERPTDRPTKTCGEHERTERECQQAQREPANVVYPGESINDGHSSGFHATHSFWTYAESLMIVNN